MIYQFLYRTSLLRLAIAFTVLPTLLSCVDNGEVNASNDAYVANLFKVSDLAIEVEGEKVSLSWVSDAPGVRIHLATQSFSAVDSVSNYSALEGYSSIDINAETSGQLIEDLANHERYYFVVTSLFCDELGEPSNEVAATPTPTPTVFKTNLNDTGITIGASYQSGNNNTCTSNSSVSAPQDCGQGRDALAAEGKLSKVGAGEAGFDFTKVSANGDLLPADANTWSCVQDNHTGLLWEVKTDDNGLHDKGSRYTWYDTNTNTNGGNAGFESSATDKNSCSGYQDGNNATYCNTQAFAARVNEQSLCGHKDWRVPSLLEQMSIMDYSQGIDLNYFPNNAGSSTQSNLAYLTSTPSAETEENVYGVLFQAGSFFSNTVKSNSSNVRLVRGE